MQQNRVVLNASRLTISILWNIFEHVFFACPSFSCHRKLVWLWEISAVPLTARTLLPPVAKRRESDALVCVLNGWCRPWDLPQQNRWLINANTRGQRRSWHMLSVSSGHCHLEMSRLPHPGLLLHRIIVSCIFTNWGFFESRRRGVTVSNSIILKIIGAINHNDGRKGTETSGVLNEIK